MRALLVKVVRPTPKTGPFTLTLAAGVVRIPLLTIKALADGIARVLSLSIMGINAPVMLIPKIDAIPEDLLLSFLIFKAYYNLIGFGPFFFVKEPRKAGQFQPISLF